jgi:hypothetical protein
MTSNELYVAKAYDMNAIGDLHSAFEPRQIESEAAAIAEAQSIAAKHDGVVVLKRAVHPAAGDYRPETIALKSGLLPEIG